METQTWKHRCYVSDTPYFSNITSAHPVIFLNISFVRLFYYDDLKKVSEKWIVLHIILQTNVSQGLCDEQNWHDKEEQ